MAPPSQTPIPPKHTLRELKINLNIHYKLKLLLHDLRNLKTNPSSEKRLQQTIDELYISSPYFTSSEAALVKNSLVTLPSRSLRFGIIEHENENEEDTQERRMVKDGSNKGEEKKTTTTEEAIKSLLCGFLDKRKASGDSRPCGPHDIAPVYGLVFGISKEELEDEGFLRRVARVGLGVDEGTSRNVGGDVTTKPNNGRKGKGDEGRKDKMKGKKGR